MTYVATILSGLMDAIDGWAASVLTETAADIETRAGKTLFNKPPLDKTFK